jgi:hypothetical protein
MLIVLDRPPARPPEKLEAASSTSKIYPRYKQAARTPRWYLLSHDYVVGLALAAGEYGALIHGAIWASLLGLLSARRQRGSA